MPSATVAVALGMAAWAGTAMLALPADRAFAASEAGREVLQTAGGLGPCTADDHPVAEAHARRGDPAGLTLSAGQLLIDQRVAQAAVRRVNQAADHLAAGLTGEDIRDCGLTVDDLDTSLAVALRSSEPAGPSTGVEPARPTPERPPPLGDPGSVRLTRGQLLINQRISQAALRRVNALRLRLDNLTAGDFRAGTVDATALGAELRLLLGRGAPANTAGSTAFVPITPGAPAARDPGSVRLTRAQLLIDQRISQAAVRRANRILAELEAGVTSRNIVDGSLVRAILAPAVQTGSPRAVLGSAGGAP